MNFKTFNRADSEEYGGGDFMITLSRTRLKEKIVFKNWQDHLMEKRRRRQHWMNQSSFRSAAAV